MDITKYLTNKDIQLSNDDINIEKLEKDIRKGYVSNEELELAKKEAIEKGTSKFTELETKYASLEKNYTALETRNTELSNSNRGLKLENEMISQGFKPEYFDEVVKLRNSLYADEEDDKKAIAGIKERFSATYFPVKEEVKAPNIPEETKFTQQPSIPVSEVKITRKTSIKDLFRK
jgi:hypothetical protein